MNEFGRNLRVMLAERDIKQKDLAQSVGVSEVAISRYINGSRTPNTQTLFRIAEIFSVDPAVLLNGKRPEGWEHIGSDKSSKFKCPFCRDVAYYPQASRRKASEVKCSYRFCPNCGKQVTANKPDLQGNQYQRD